MWLYYTELFIPPRWCSVADAREIDIVQIGDKEFPFNKDFKASFYGAR